MTLEIEAQRPPLHPIYQIPRVPSTCDRHPDQNVTGFCASCLRERLAGLETTAAPPRKSTSSALKSIFFKAGGGGGQPSSSDSSSLRPELRRCKSFSGSRADGSSGPRASASFEPQRKSCDVRGRNTLWSLFHQDDKHRVGAHDPFLPSSSSSAAISAAVAGAGQIEIDSRNLAFPASSVTAPVPEAREEEERDDDGDDDEIRPVDPVPMFDTSMEIRGREDEDVELKTMKVHIDLESQVKNPPSKEPKEIAGSFWLAASVFSKKLQTWRRKQKLKKHSNKPASSIRQEKTLKPSRASRETQSEIAVDAFGRRSCDVDPRFSLDAGRMSFDDPRASWDAPRASWDGYMIGGRSVFPRLPPMLSVMEDVHTPAVERWDSQIPVEEDSAIPGGSVQTRDYYLDSSSSRRRSLDRSNSVRMQAAEINEPKPVSNAKVSPAGGTEFFHNHYGSKLDRDSRELSSNSLRDDCSESFRSAFRDSQKESHKKKSWRWSKAWNIWGFMYRQSSSKEGGANVVERSFSESWPELRAQEYNGKILRSNSNVSSRSSYRNNSGFGSMRSSNVETNGHGKKRREEFVLERNRSARYSPSHIDNGLLRFYLTPMRGSRRNGMSGKNRQGTSYSSFTRTVLGMY